MLDIFNNDAFSVASMTAKVNKIPFVPGQVGASGIFDEQGVTTKLIAIEEQNGQLALVAPSPRGGPGETTDNDKRKIRAFEIAHYQRDDAVMADEVQGVRAFGSDINNPDAALQSIEQVIEQKSARHTRALDATLEHQRVGAIKGIVTDKNGNTMWDLFNLYGLSAPTPIEFNLDQTTTDVRSVCFDVIDTIEAALDGIAYSGVHSFVGNDFWKALISHKSVKETYLNTVSAMELRGSMHVFKFEFGGITFERYRTGTRAAASNTSGAFIGASEARFVALGVPELFITRFAPADYVDTVNTIGLPRYSKQFAMPNDKGRNLEIQMNAISLCTRPEVLQSGVATHN